jgi:eukaryotic-like serine/threonine-protein kinase
MNRERWEQVSEILDQALRLPLRERSVYLAQIAASDPDLHREVNSLIASHEQAGSEFLNTLAAPTGSVQSAITGRDSKVGRRLGPYQIVELIGVGGMGEVYRAVRADDQYSKQVALKLVRSGQDSSFVINRFKNERQILASLDHPNIARLLDGGTTEEGVPYFVMELIEGKTIDRYCNDRNLATIERLTLFLQICSAVQLAHQRLIVHRDLKPGNILVTADGVPRLLDFGIAKLLDPGVGAEGAEPTRTMTQFRAFTPGYASPEQLKGEPITTASDVYSLGVVLYELLTGCSPYGSTGRTLHELTRAVCELEPEKPSTAIRRRSIRERNGLPSPAGDVPVAVAGDSNKLSRRLRGDLDNIVLMALRKEPERRYSSVEQFAQDIRRHLENLPVTARQDTAVYRASKFVTRHKTGVAATAVFAILLLAALLVTVREARIARKQAELARAQRARAEQRFNDVRKLANSLIFEIHDSIQNLPGATPARKLVMDRAVQYLDSLAKDSSGDPALQRELGSAYHRLGLVQGNPSEGNLGDTEAAKVSFRKSAALFESVARADPNNVTDQLTNAFGHRILAFASSPGGNDRQQIEQAMAITERLMKVDGANPKVRSERSIEFGVLAGTQEAAGDLVSALESYRQALAMNEELLKTNPSYPRIRQRVAIGTVQVGDELARLGLRREALQTNQSGIELYESVSKNEKTDARTSRELAVTWVKRGDIELMDGNAAEALRDYRRGFSLVEPMALADPQNSMLRLDVGGDSLEVGKALAYTGKYAEGLVMLRRAIPILEKEHSGDPSNTDIPHVLALAYIWQGEISIRTGIPREASEAYRKAIAVLESSNDLKDANTQGELASSYTKLASSLTRIGDLPEAATASKKALDIIQPLASAKNPPALYVSADANYVMGEVERAIAVRSAADQQRQHWIEARDSYQKSQDAWRQISSPGAVSPAGYLCGNPREVANAIVLCDRALRNGSRAGAN